MRLVGWEQRLLEAHAFHSAQPFTWGLSDCFLWPMDAVRALTGADPWQAEREYATARGAQRRLTAQGFTHIGEAFAAKFPEGAPMLARRGDIGLADYPGCDLGGGVVVMGTHVVGKSEAGLVRLPRALMYRAFRVGW